MEAVLDNEISIEDDYDLVRLSLSEMMQSDGYEHFRRLLLMKRQDQIKKMLGLLPTEANLMNYADARAKIQLLEEMLSYRASDILDVIRDYTHE